jgi:hypothetical protein
MHTYARHMHDICTDMHEYIHFPLGTPAKWTCMYWYVFDCMCMYVFLSAYLYVSVFMRMYLIVSSRWAYQFSQVHMCKIDVCVCIMYVSCMYVFFCMYLVCIMYVQVCVCTACISPNKYSCMHNFTTCFRASITQAPLRAEMSRCPSALFLHPGQHVRPDLLHCRAQHASRGSNQGSGCHQQASHVH